jgi:hypothetical protein
MQPEAASAIQLLFRALALARSSGAPEIEIDHLIAALDADVLDQPIAKPVEGPYFAVPAQDMPLAPDVIAALEPLGGISAIPLGVLRSALLSAKRQAGIEHVEEH